jgi:hypothetical protein
MKSKNLTEQIILNELKQIANIGHPITQAQLIKLKRFDLLNGLRKFGTLNSFKKKLGIKLKKRTYNRRDHPELNQVDKKRFAQRKISPIEHWSNIENIEKELLPFVKKYGRMPKDSELRKEKKSALIGAIYRKFGNYYNLALLMNIPVSSKPKYFYTPETILQMYKSICIQNGKFLTHSELSTAGQGMPYSHYTPDKLSEEYKTSCL